MVLWGILGPFAHSTGVTENKLLAAFVLSVAKFTNWTARSVINAPEHKIRIAVLGNPDLGQEISTLAQGKSIANHGIEVSVLSGADELESTDKNQATPEVIVIIPAAAGREGRSTEMTDKVLRKIKGCKCLTLTFQNEGTSSESTINFFTREDHLKFEANVSRAKQEELELSSQLLKLSTPR